MSCFLGYPVSGLAPGMDNRWQDIWPILHLIYPLYSLFYTILTVKLLVMHSFESCFVKIGPRNQSLLKKNQLDITEQAPFSRHPCDPSVKVYF